MVDNVKKEVARHISALFEQCPGLIITNNGQVVAAGKDAARRWAQAGKSLKIERSDKNEME